MPQLQLPIFPAGVTEINTRVAVEAKDGLVKDVPATNGLAFSPDEKYLCVNGSCDNYVNRYEVRPDGTLANGKLFIDMSKATGTGVTDGLRVDTKGNLYETGPGCVWIVSAEGKESRHHPRAGDFYQYWVRRRRQ